MTTVSVSGVGEVEFPDEMSQDDIHAALQKNFRPEVDFSKIKPEPVYQPSQYSFGGGAFVSPAENPDYEFSRATKANPAMALLGSGVRALSEKVIEPAATTLFKQLQTATNVGDPSTQRQSQPLVIEEGQPMIPESVAPYSKAGEEGAIASGTRILRGMTTPGGVATLPLAAFKPIQLYYASGALAEIPESISRIEEAKTPAQLRGAITEFGANTAMAGLMSKGLIREHAATLPRATAEAAKTIEGVENATQERKVTEGNQPEYPGAEGERLPTEAGGSNRPARSQAPTEGPQGVLLSPEDQAYLDTERSGIDSPIEVQSGETISPKSETISGNVETPFAARKWEAGDFMRANHETGKIEVNAPEYSGWLNSVPAERRSMAVRSRLFEEQQHLQTSPEDAQSYWGTLTPAEQAMERRIYTGKWKGVPRFTDTQYGFEAIRRQKQRLARMDTSEAAEAALKERWTVKSLEALNATIRKTRETLGTNASKEGLAILARIEQNTNAAIDAIKTGNPAAYNKNFQGTAEDALKQPDGTLSPQDILAMPEEEYRKLIMAKDGNGDHLFSTTEQASIWAMKQSPDIVPELKRLQSEQLQKELEAIDAGKIHNPGFRLAKQKRHPQSCTGLAGKRVWVL